MSMGAACASVQAKQILRLSLKDDTKKTMAGAAFRSYAKKIRQPGFLGTFRPCIRFNNSKQNIPMRITVGKRKQL